MFGDPNDEIRDWAARIARAYAEASNPRLAPDLEAWLQKHLNTPLADCIILALPPDEWALLQLDPQMDRWEAIARQRPGPRIASVDYGAGAVTMGPWRKSRLKWTER